MTEDRKPPPIEPPSADESGEGAPLSELERLEKELGFEEADGSPGFILFGAPVVRPAAEAAEPPSVGSSRFLDAMRRLVGG